VNTLTTAVGNLAVVSGRGVDAVFCILKEWKKNGHEICISESFEEEKILLLI